MWVTGNSTNDLCMIIKLHTEQILEGDEAGSPIWYLTDNNRIRWEVYNASNQDLIESE